MFSVLYVLFLKIKKENVVYFEWVFNRSGIISLV